jgi:hypothetical protein
MFSPFEKAKQYLAKVLRSGEFIRQPTDQVAA